MVSEQYIRPIIGRPIIGRLVVHVVHDCSPRKYRCISLTTDKKVSSRCPCLDKSVYKLAVNRRKILLSSREDIALQETPTECFFSYNDSLQAEHVHPTSKPRKAIYRGPRHENNVRELRQKTLQGLGASKAIQFLEVQLEGLLEDNPSSMTDKKQFPKSTYQSRRIKIITKVINV